MRSNRPRWVRGLAPATGLCLLGALPGCGRPASRIPEAPRSVTAIPSTTSTSVAVRWAPPSGGVEPDRYLVTAATAGSIVGSVVCTGAGCRSEDIPGLIPGAVYTFAVRAGSSDGYSGAVQARRIVVSTGCATAAVCLTVDGTRPEAVLSHNLNGLLHGMAAYTPPSLVTALHPGFWRLAVSPPPCNQPECQGYREYDRVARFGPAVIAVLSDAWYTASYAAGQDCRLVLVCAQGTNQPAFAGATPPWSDWPRYDAFITATVAATVTSRHPVGYWDLVNEPPARTPQNDRYFSASVSQTLTASELEQWLLHTYRDVRRADPAARVVCPSLESYTDYSGEVPDYDALLDFSTFVAFAARNGLRCDAFSWHEINVGGTPTDFNNQPEDIQDHVSRFRALLGRYPSLAGAEIFLDEYGATVPPGGAEPYDAMPGWDVGYLAAMLSSGVAEANRSCASGAACDGLLDDLAVPDGSTLAPASAYWPYWFYTGMVGRVLPLTSSAEQVGALASLERSPDVLSVLGGRHETVDGGGVRAPTNPAPESVSLTIKVPWPVTEVVVQVRSYPNSVSPTGLPPTTTWSAPVSQGNVSITLPALGAEDAFSVTLTPGA